MAHNITIRNGFAHAAVGRGIDSWHHFNKVFDQLMDEIQALEIKPPTINTEQAYILWDGEFVKAGNFAVTVADFGDTKPEILGQVTMGYRENQYQDLIEVMRSIFDRWGPCIDSTAVLGNGAIFYILIKVPDIFEKQGDRSDKYILGYTKNDGTGSLVFRPTYVRVVCENTFNAALGRKVSEYRIRHSGNMESKLEDARKYVDKAVQSFESSDRVFEDMFEVAVTPTERLAFVSEVFGIDRTKKYEDQSTYRQNQLDEISRIFAVGRGAQGKSNAEKETLWHLFNTVTEYVDHSPQQRGSKQADQRFLKAQFGTGQKTKENAFQLAHQIVQANGKVEEVLEMVAAPMDVPADAGLEDLVQF